MNARAIGLSVFALVSLAGTALAQPGGGTYVSGMEHTSLGGAALGTPTERKLTVSNIGSSGQDGVEVKWRTAYGGGSTVGVGPLLDTPGAELKIKRKGWDGLIYGTHRLTSNGDGTGMFEFDFSGLGATALHVVEYDASGNVVSDFTGGGGVVNKEWVPNFTCPDGSQPIIMMRWMKSCASCDWFLWIGWMCLGTGDEFTYENNQGRIIVTPTLPVPAPFDPATESVLITASGIPEIVIDNDELHTFSAALPGLPPGEPYWEPLSVHGIGQGHISEECDSGLNDCDQSERRLTVSNIGSSGQDGVAIELPGHRATGMEMGIKKGDCCPSPGHTTLLTLADDGGLTQSVSRTLLDPLSGMEELDADFSDIGAYGWRLTLLDPGGVVVGPPGGTDIISGGPRPIFSDNCPPGSVAHYYNAGTTSNPVWVLWWCESINNFVLPGGTVVPNVASCTIEPLGASSHYGPIAECRLTGVDGERTITDLHISNACPSDFNLDGFVSGDDFDAFVLAFERGDPSADFNFDTFVSGDDFDAFVLAFEAGC